MPTSAPKHRITYPECIAALDAALTGLMPKLTGEQLQDVRDTMLANNEAVAKEMKRREFERVQGAVT